MEATTYFVATLITLGLVYLTACLTFRAYFKSKMEFTISLYQKIKEISTNG